MPGYIPRNKISLVDAVELAADAWYSQEMPSKSLAPEHADLYYDYLISLFLDNKTPEQMQFLEALDRDLIKSFEKLAEKERSNRANYLEEAWERLVHFLFEGAVTVRFVNKETGHTHDVPSRFWGTDHGRTIYDQRPERKFEPWILSFPLDEDWETSWGEGVPFVDPNELEAALAHCAVTDETPRIGIVPQENPNNQAAVPAMLSDSQDLTQEQTERSTGPKKQRCRPQRARAEARLNELYPNGVPPQEKLPNKRLLREVNQDLDEELKLDSVLRAANRRPEKQQRQ